MRNALPLKADRHAFRWLAWLPSRRRLARGSDGSRPPRPANRPTSHADSHREMFPDERAFDEEPLKRHLRRCESVRCKIGIALETNSGVRTR